MDPFDYFQIITLAAFLSVFFGRTLWLKRKGTQVVVIGSGKQGFAAWLEKSFIVFFPVWLFEVINHALHLNIQFLPSALIEPLFFNVICQVIGVAAILIGILVFVPALVSFKSSWRVGIDTRAPGELITEGIFAFSRNPIFLSMDLYFLGTFLIYRNLFFLSSFICLAAGKHWQILHEEAYLDNQYGEQYRSYMAQVKRYI
jgi:protein-S-isoprenylcysteine O-methyltransferase Ste14